MDPLTTDAGLTSCRHRRICATDTGRELPLLQHDKPCRSRDGLLQAYQFPLSLADAELGAVTSAPVVTPDSSALEGTI